MAARTRPPAEALAPQHHPRLGSQLQLLAQHQGFCLASQLQSAPPLRQGRRGGVPTSCCSLSRRRRVCRSRQERHLEVGADTLHPHFHTRIESTKCDLEPRRVIPEASTALEATQGQNDSFFSQLPYKCYLEEVASVGD